MDYLPQSASPPSSSTPTSSFPSVECSTCPKRHLSHCSAFPGCYPVPLELVSACPEGRWSRPVKRLKVLWVMGDFAQGGTTRYTKDLFDILAPLPIDFKVVYCNDRHLDRATLAAMPCQTTAHSPESYQGLVDWADIVSVLGVNTFMPNCTDILQPCKGKMFGQIHGSCEYSEGLVKLYRRYTDRFMCCSKKAQALVQAPSTSFVPQSPLDFNRVSRQTSKVDAKKALGFVPEQRLAVVACRQSHDKALPLIAKVVASLPSVHLLCVGSGYAEQEIHTEMDRILGSRVTYKSWLESPAIYLDAADCFLCLSPNEGLPLSIIEAMAHGTPVVATDVGIVKEYVLHSPGQLDQQICFSYHSPEDVLRAMEPLQPEVLHRISQYIQLRHSPSAIRLAWKAWLGL